MKPVPQSILNISIISEMFLDTNSLLNCSNKSYLYFSDKFSSLIGPVVFLCVCVISNMFNMFKQSGIKQNVTHHCSFFWTPFKLWQGTHSLYGFVFTVTFMQIQANANIYIFLFLPFYIKLTYCICFFIPCSFPFYNAIFFFFLYK